MIFPPLPLTGPFQPNLFRKRLSPLVGKKRRTAPGQVCLFRAPDFSEV